MKKIISLFDGMSCGYIALRDTLSDDFLYYASEIDTLPDSVSKRNFPDIIRLGDVRNVKIVEQDIFMLIGGSPCQDLSKANVRGKGLEGEKSGLFFEYLRILKEANPKYFFLENVGSMKKSDKEIITEELECYYPESKMYFFDSQAVSAQKRRRYYWTNIPNINTSKDYENILLNDILDDSDSYCIWEDVPDIYISENSVRIPEATIKGYIDLIDGDCVDMAYPNSKTRRGRLMREKSNSVMTSNQFYRYKIIDGEHKWRKFTNKEFCRLQGVDPNILEGLSNNQVQQIIGNGWNIPTIKMFFSGINIQ